MLVATSALGHGFVIKIVNNKITIESSEDPVLNPLNYTPYGDSFQAEMSPATPYDTTLFANHGSVTGYQQPGITVHSPAQPAVDDVFHFDLVSPLVYSDGFTSQATPGDVNMLIHKGTTSVNVTGTAANTPGFNITAYSAHETLKYLSNWSVDGAYAYAYRVSGHTAAGAAFVTSEPMVVVLFTPTFADPGSTDTNVFLAGAANAYFAALGMWSPTAGGNWGSVSNWTNLTVPSGNTATARFFNNATGASIVDLQNTDRTVKHLTFNNSNSGGSYTIGSTGTGRLILDADSGNADIVFDSGNTNDHSISAKLRLNANVDVSAGSGRTLTLAGEIDWNSKQVNVQTGKLKLNNATATNVVTGSTLLIQSGATAELAGTTSGLSTLAGRIAVTNSGNILVTGSNQAAGLIDGTGGLTVAANGVLNVDAIRQGTLELHGTASNNSGNLTVRTSGSTPAGSNATVSRVTMLTIANDNTVRPTPYLAKTYYATLDLTNNDLIIDSANLADVSDMLRAGANHTSNLPWTGTGLTSSSARAGNPLAGKTGLGVILNVINPTLASSETNSAQYPTFDGVTAPTDAILVKYTWYGDFNLDGQVTSFDFALLDAGFAGAKQIDGQPGWFFGDTNLDGQVNSFDYSLANSGYLGYSGGGQLPEPSSFALLVLTVVIHSVLRRTRRWAPTAC